MRRFLIIVLLFGLSLIFDSTPPPTLALTSINVTTTVDELTTNGQCSLREAIMLVNNGIANDCGSVGSLNFLINVPAGIYTITIGNTWEDTNLDGDFDITTNAEIQLYGDTPATTIIQSSVIAPTEPPTPGQADYRLFHLHNPNGELSLGNLTLRHGYRSDDNGGAILVDGGGISLTNVHITKNIAQSGSAIFNTNLWTNFVQVEIYENQSIGTLGTLVLNNGRMLDSIVRDNISNSAVVLTNYDSYSILNSQIEYNTSLIGNGVIWNQKSLLLDQSTFVTNNGGSAGGVIYNDGSLFVRDSYFEGNTAIEGSVVYTQGELTKIRKSTFVDNGGNSTFYVGNLSTQFYAVNSTLDGNTMIHNEGINSQLINVTIANTGINGSPTTALLNDGELAVQNTLIAYTNGTNCDLDGITNTGIFNDVGGNLEYPTTSCGFAGNLNDGTNDPLLQPLASNGTFSFTDTMALGVGSPAIDGSGVVCPVLSGNADQRDYTRDSSCDIGAYEANVSAPPSTVIFNVTTLEDDTMGDGECSIREAFKTLDGIQYGNCHTTSSGTGLINIPAGIYTLQMGELLVSLSSSNHAWILGVPGQTVIQASDVSPARWGETPNPGQATHGVFRLGSQGNFVIDGLVIQNGYYEHGGGLILAGTYDNLEVHNSIFRNNSARRGGGIYSDRIIITNTTFDSNSAELYGAAFYNDGGPVVMTNITVSNNIADRNILLFQGDTTIQSSTIANNDPGIGQAVRAYSNLNIRTTIIADNGIDCKIWGTIIDEGYNISSDDTCGFGDTNGAGVGSNVDPRVKVLGDNGGPTPTINLDEGSPAIDPVGNTACTPTDQRGYPRDTPCDIGAVEVSLHNHILVTTPVDEIFTNGQCSLREAINVANGQVVPDCVQASHPIIIDVPAGTYTISLTGTGDDLNLSGDFDITQNVDVAIVGTGEATTIIQASSVAPSFVDNPPVSGQADDRVFDVVSPLGFLTLNNMTVRYGYVSSAQNGAGIRANGKYLGVNNALVSNNTASNWGGAIYTASNTTFKNRNTTITNNSASDGGAFASDGPVVISNSAISDNHTNTNIVNLNGTALIKESSIFDNQGSNSILDLNGQTLIKDSSFSGNQTDVMHVSSSVTIRTSTFNNNNIDMTTINSSGTLTIVDSSFTGNQGNSSTVIASNGTLIIKSSTFANNGTSTNGSTFLIEDGSTKIFNSTLANNGNANPYEMEVLVLGDLEIINTTIADSNALSDIYNEGQTTLENTILGNQNRTTICNLTANGGNFTDEGGNLEFPGISCGFSGLLNNGTNDPVLQPLADNGGPTKTLALGIGSAAINGTGETCPVQIDWVDQRGFPRDSNCDIGAYEFDGLLQSNDALALFDPATSATVIYRSVLDNPGTLNYTNTPPTNTAPVWVMGDWDGDGAKTPGYFDSGVFRYTNDLGPTTNWSQGWWFGFASTQVGIVSGRFDPAFNNDCFGLIDANVHGGTGDLRFSLKYWCNMTVRPQDPGGGPLLKQWHGSPLPDSGNFTGTHQWVYGDWDNDGLDEPAVRRGGFINRSENAPSEGAATYGTGAQRWDTADGDGPGAHGLNDGLFVAGDWNGDGVDTWGVVYDDDTFYYRDVFGWNPGPFAFSSQTFTSSIATPRQVDSHHNATGGSSAPGPASPVVVLAQEPTSLPTQIPATSTPAPTTMPTSTATHIPPSITPAPTSTPISVGIVPTTTPVPSTDTPAPTMTSEPSLTPTPIAIDPTATDTPLPTATEVPPTATDTPLPTATVIPDPVRLPVVEPMDDGAPHWLATGSWTLTEAASYNPDGLGWQATRTDDQSTLQFYAPIILGNVAYPNLRFQSNLQASHSTAQVEISLDAQTWLVVGVIQPGEGWVEQSIDLRDYRSMTIYLRFNWVSSEVPTEQTSDWWLVDEVDLRNHPLEDPTATPEPVETTPTDVPSGDSIGTGGQPTAEPPAPTVVPDVTQIGVGQP